MNQFQVKASFTSIDEENRITRASHQYVVAAESFGEAESFIQKTLEDEDTVSELKIQSITLKDYSLIRRQEEKADSKWFICKISREATGVNGKTKSESEQMLIRAASIPDVFNYVTNLFANSICDTKVDEVKDGKIDEVFENVIV